MHLNERNRNSRTAALAAGLAMLAKSAGFALGPFAILCIAVLSWRERDIPSGIRRFLLWGVAAALVYVLLWPAMWVDPIGTLFRECDAPCNDGVLVKMFADNFEQYVPYIDEDVKAAAIG